MLFLLRNTKYYRSNNVFTITAVTTCTVLQAYIEYTMFKLGFANRTFALQYGYNNDSSRSIEIYGIHFSFLVYIIYAYVITLLKGSK